MSWQQHLDVVDGKVIIEEWGQPGTYTVEGFLKCAQNLRVRFLKARYHPSHPVLEPDPGNIKELRATGERVYVKPRKRPVGSQPTTFLELCRRLIAPLRQEGEKCFGYVFSADLELDGWKADPIKLDDESYLEHSFVQFAEFQEPFRFIAYRDSPNYVPHPERYPVGGLTALRFFKLRLALDWGWPLSVE